MHCADYMRRTHQVSPLYGLYWNFCLNWGRSRKFVMCLPHSDAANLAIGLCTIFIMGELSNWTQSTDADWHPGLFRSRERCWLCIWDTGIVIEIPAGTALTYPSALFYHFNYGGTATARSCPDVADLAHRCHRYCSGP